MSLREIQREFAQGLLDGDDAAVRARLRPGRFGAERHLQIYRNNVYASLSGALEAVYPVVARLVGPDCFGGCARAYIRRSPPRSGNLHDFGAGFADFLREFEAVRALAYLPDVARLEWSWHGAFHAADSPPLALDALARVPPAQYEALHLRLHPSVHLLASDYPLLDIWRANQPDAAADEVIDLAAGGQNLLVARRRLTVEVERIGDAEFALLHAFAEGRGLQLATQQALQREPGFDLTAALRRRVQDQTITGFGLEPPQWEASR